MEGCWFLSTSQINVVKNLKDYINLLLGGCFTLEHMHVLAKFCPLSCSKMCHGKLEVLQLTQVCF